MQLLVLLSASKLGEPAKRQSFAGLFAATNWMF